MNGLIGVWGIRPAASKIPGDGCRTCEGCPGRRGHRDGQEVPGSGQQGRQATLLRQVGPCLRCTASRTR
jgi:hypothetical protein